METLPAADVGGWDLEQLGLGFRFQNNWVYKNYNSEGLSPRWFLHRVCQRRLSISEILCGGGEAEDAVLELLGIELFP